MLSSDGYASKVNLRSITTTTKEPPDYRDYDSPAYEDVSHCNFYQTCIRGTNQNNLLIFLFQRQYDDTIFNQDLKDATDELLLEKLPIDGSIRDAEQKEDLLTTPLYEAATTTVVPSTTMKTEDTTTLETVTTTNPETTTGRLNLIYKERL